MFVEKIIEKKKTRKRKKKKNSFEGYGWAHTFELTQTIGSESKALVSISINSVDILAQKEKLFKKNIFNNE